MDPCRILEKIKNNEKLTAEEVKQLILQSMDLFIDDSNLICLNSPITICGDIHGQLEDLFKLFEVSGGEDQPYLFMGDFVDRGYYSIDTICYLLALRLKNGNVWLLRGNHETRNVNATYGFYNECQRHFCNNEIYRLFNALFDMFPIAALIDYKVFSVHGGLSPSLRYIEDINDFDRVREPPSTGVISDLMWSDPADSDSCSWDPSPRGSGYIFGKEQCKKFVHENGLEFITRSHQLVEEGILWYFDNTLVDIWSAPNYSYVSGNKATTMKYTGLPATLNEVTTFEENEVRRPIEPVSEPVLYFA